MCGHMVHACVHMPPSLSCVHVVGCEEDPCDCGVGVVRELGQLHQLQHTSKTMCPIDLPTAVEEGPTLLPDQPPSAHQL